MMLIIEYGGNKMNLETFERMFEEFVEKHPDRFASILARGLQNEKVQDKLFEELEKRSGRRNFLRLTAILASIGLLGGTAGKASASAVIKDQEIKIGDWYIPLSNAKKIIISDTPPENPGPYDIWIEVKSQ